MSNHQIKLFRAIINQAIHDAMYDGVYKYHIIDLANRHKINLSQTQSCLRELKEHCGICWQCLERQWGYKQLEGEV